jgi:hypothetical protein
MWHEMFKTIRAAITSWAATARLGMLIVLLAAVYLAVALVGQVVGQA